MASNGMAYVGSAASWASLLPSLMAVSVSETLTE